MNIAEVLGASIEQALPRFEAHPRIHRALALLHDMGLGYLTLCQSSPTLSGGEAQRISSWRSWRRWTRMRRRGAAGGWSRRGRRWRSPGRAARIPGRRWRGFSTGVGTPNQEGAQTNE